MLKTHYLTSGKNGVHGERISWLFFLIQKYSLLLNPAESSLQLGTSSLASCETTACLLGTLMNVFLWCFQKHGCDSPDQIPELPSGREICLLNLFCSKNSKEFELVMLWKASVCSDCIWLSPDMFGVALCQWRPILEGSWWLLWCLHLTDLPPGLELSPSLKEHNKLAPHLTLTMGRKKMC